MAAEAAEANAIVSGPVQRGLASEERVWIEFLDMQLLSSHSFGAVYKRTTQRCLWEVDFSESIAMPTWQSNDGTSTICLFRQREPRKKLLPRAKPCLSMKTTRINHVELVLVSGIITQLLTTRLTTLSGLHKLTRLSLLISQAASWWSR